MTDITLILAAHTTTDVDTARRLTDYGDLDDAGVARALEQVYVQRWGRSDPPGYLRRIESLAAIADVGGTLRLIRPEARGERQQLTELFASWPGADVELVDWDGRSRSLLLTRAVANDIVLPPAFMQGVDRALADAVAPDALEHLVPSEQVERECLWLMAGCEPGAAMEWIAGAYYRLWLRWQYCLGHMEASERQAREARLAELQGLNAI